MRHFLPEKRTFLLLIAGVFVLFLSLLFSTLFDGKLPLKEAYSSAELGYSSYSTRGIAGGAIIPASCELGDCHGDIPAVPTNLSGSCPAPGTTASYSWSASPGAASYDFRADFLGNGWSGSCDGAQNPGDACHNQGGTAFSMSANPGDQFRWWVHACNSQGGCSAPASGGTITCTPPPPLCSDGIDNDGDGLTDFPADPGCSGPTDNDEFDSPSPACNGGIDIGIRMQDGTGTKKIAVEPGGPTSLLRIYKGGVRGIVLVAPTDANASKIRLKTPAGVQALCALP